MSNEKKPELEFPCEAPVKVFGLNTEKFVEDATKKIFELYGEDKEILTKVSKGDKYISLTVNVSFESKEQYDVTHQALLQMPGVVFLL